MASKASTRAATIQDIQDENVLREMWLETQDADSKREIRSRMYKLREERLKEYYGREGVIETILKPNVTLEGKEVSSVGVSTTVIESRDSRTAAVTVSGERDVVVISSSGGTLELEEGGECDKDEPIRTRITKKDRALQYKEIKGNQRITSTTTTTTVTSVGKVVREGEESVAVRKTLSVTATANGLSNDSKGSATTNNMITNENGVREKRRGGSREATSTVTTTTATQSAGRVSKSNVSSSSVRNKTSSLEERENNINSRKRSSGEGRRGRVDESPVQTKRITSPAKGSKVTSKDSFNKSEKETKGGPSKASKTDAEGINPTSNSAVVCTEEAEESAFRATTRASKTSITANATNGYSSKDKTGGSANKSRESSPKSRLPTRAGSQPPKDKEAETKSSTTSRGRAGAGNSTAKVNDEPEKVKAEQSIIRELDILDNFLSQRSTSIDEGPVVREESATVAATVAKLNGTAAVEKEIGLDVMEIGVEPPFTKTAYKYNCPGDDEHDGDADHHHHPRRPNNDRNANEKKKSQLSPTKDGKGNFEDEIITESVPEPEKGKRSRANPGNSTTTTKPTTTRNSRTSNNATSTTSRVRGERDTSTTATSKSSATEPNAPDSRESRANQRRKPTTTQLSSKINVEIEEPKIKATEFKVTETQSKQQKYEADILSRPSVFEKRKAKPEPNPRIRKSSDSSPERVSTETKRQTSSPRLPRKEKAESREITENDLSTDNHRDERDEDDDDPLKPQKRFESRGKGLESPGAVLKAKSLFETKAQEAATDRSSADFDSSLTARASFKVSKKAALFEARSRGERVSVSSESSLCHPLDDKELLDEKDAVQSTNVESRENKSRVEESVFATEVVATTKAEISNTTISKRRQSREKILRDEVSKQTAAEKRTAAAETARKERISNKTATRPEISRSDNTPPTKTEKTETPKAEIPKTENPKAEIPKTENPKTVTARKTSRKLEVKAEGEGATSTRQERVKSSESRTENKRESPAPSSKTKTSAVAPVSPVAATTATTVVTTTTTASSIATNKVASSATATTEVNIVESIESVEELETLLDKATDYDERSKIRARIRILKRKCNLDKEKEKETKVNRSDQSPARKKSPTGKTSTDDKSTAEKKGYEGRKSSGEIPPNKVTSRKKSREISESTKVVSKADECIVRRRSSSSNMAKVTPTPNDNKTEKIARKNSRDKDSTNECSSPRRNSQETTETGKRCYKGKENQTTEEKNATVMASAVEDASSTTATTNRRVSSRKNSAETNELLSTRKYSRERRGSADEENIRNESKKGILSRENSRDKGIQPKSSATGKIETTITKKSNEVRNLRESNSIESSSVSTSKKQVSSRTSEVISTSRKASRDSSPPKILNSVPENSTATQEIIISKESEELISSRGQSPVRKRDSVSPQRSSIPLSTRRYSRDSCSPPKSPGPDIGIVEEPMDSESENKRPEIILPEEETLVHVEEIKESVIQEKVVTPAAAIPAASKTKKSSSRKNSEELFGTSNSRRGSTEQTKGISRKKSTEEPTSPSGTSGGKRNSYSRKSSSKELKTAVSATEEKSTVDSVLTKGEESSSPTTRSGGKGREGDSKERERSRESGSQSRRQSNAENKSVSSTATTVAHTPTPTKVSGSSTTSTRRNFGSSSTTTSTTHSSSTRNSGATKVQGPDTVTSSYGVGPTDDDGQPLFGLRALRKIKQVQEQMASEKTAAETPSPSHAEEERKASVRSNDMYGLRALKKGSSGSGARPFSSSSPANSSPERSLRDKNSSSPTKEMPDVLTKNSGGVVESQDDKYTSSSPKSILKKTSSFTSNKSESKTDVDAVGLSTSSTNIASMTTSTSAVAETVSSSFSSSSVTSAHVSRTVTSSSSSTSVLGKSKEDWLRKSKSPEPSSASSLSLTGSLSRGKVGRSSVREMSKRFEGPSSLESDGSAKNGNPLLPELVSLENSANSTVAVAARKTIHVYSETNKSRDSDELDDSFPDDPSKSMTKTTVVTSATRSFLTDRTPVKDLTDVMQRMKADTDEGIGHDNEDSDLSLLNKFIGAQIIMQAVEPMLLTTTKVSMSQSLCINGVDVGQETDANKLKQLLDECEGEEERGIIQNRLKSLGESESIVIEEEGGEAPPTKETTTVTETEGVSSADVTGELMPLILGQLQSSLENLSASGGGGGGGSVRNTTESGVAVSISSSRKNSSSVKCGGEPEEVDSSEECLFDSGTESGEDLANNGHLKEGNSEVGREEGPADSPLQFSSFMQGLRNSLQNSTRVDVTSDAAFVLEKLGVGAFQSPAGGGNPSIDNKTEELSQAQTTDANLIQQVDSVLSLLKDSLLKDPNCLSPKSEASDKRIDASKGKELISLIDRLKDSLVSGEGPSDKNHSSPLPTVVGRDSSSSSSSPSLEMAAEGCEMYGGWTEPRPPDLVPYNEAHRRNSNPWTNNYYREEQKNNLNGSNNEPLKETETNEQTTEIPWKVRAAKRRSHARSHTVGVSVEELAEARRYLEEQAMRTALLEDKQASKEKDLSDREKIAPIISPLSELIQPLSPPPLSAPPVMVSPFRKGNWQSDIQKRLTSVPRPFVKGEMSMYKYPQVAPYTSCDDSSVVTGGIKLKPFRTFSLDSHHDPSISLFTPEETVQIAIHKAAIKKQMSEEEDRRKRRNSLTSYNNNQVTVPQPRDFSLALPKPYSPPQNQSGSGSGSSGNSPNTKSVSYPLQSADSGFNEEQMCRNDAVMVYDASQMSPSGNNSNNNNLQQPPSPQRIENVQISLKELNSSEFPQLQIAITLNTNNNNGNNNISNNSTESAQSLLRNNNPSQHLHNNLTNSASVETLVQPAFLSPSNGETSTTPTPLPATNSKICRYKTKTERKKKMKRANTIDIPHPPGYLFSNDDDTGMDDEEESDRERSSSISNLPFKAKTEGDKKFLAFLEKNNAMAESRPARPSYLSVNDKSDKYWNNRFFNLKTSFESSSQGSSPSVSPSPLSPGKAPRSVSELALTHGRYAHDVYSKPVWANTDPAQLPPQVKNKLHVFENRMLSNSSSEYRLPTEAWRSPPPPANSYAQQRNQNPYQSAFTRRNNVANTNNSHHRASLHERKLCFENKQFDMVQPSSSVPQNVQKPVAVKPKGPQPPAPPGKVHEGVHMVHATASAMQAMKKSQFVPPPPPPAIPPRTSHPPQLPRSAPTEQIGLPWAKKDFIETNQKDDTRIKMSKALFEQMQKPAQPVPPPIPAKPKSIAEEPHYYPGKRGDFDNFQKFGGSVQNISSSQGFTPIINTRAPMQSAQSVESAVMGGRPKLGVFGVTRSFDEAVKQKYEAAPQRMNFNEGGVSVGTRKDFSHPPQQQHPHHTYSQDLHQAARGNNSGGNSNVSISGTNKVEFQRSAGSAFVRQVSTSEPSSRRNSEDKPEKTGAGEDETSVNTLVLTPVVSKVMRGPTQQRATVMSNRMSSLNDEAQQPSRLTNARSNIRSILNQYHPTASISPDSAGSASDASPPIVKGNLQLALPPLVKSHSGDAVLQSNFRPPTNSALVLKEEVTFQTPAAAPPPAIRNPALVPARKEQHNPAIPRQTSLAEFPRMSQQLTIEVEPPTPPTPKSPTKSHQQQPPQFKPNTMQSTNSANHPQATNQQKQNTLRSFPAADPPPHQQQSHLQRTSSGTSIFNRTQHLFISAHDATPPQTKLRPKPPPSLPRSQVLFPKQFEAQMSPDSADKKKREIEDYFRQQSQSKKKSLSQGSQLRKSASHSKIMHRQRSISDGEDDVDQIFESLFKASVDSKAKKSAEAVESVSIMSASQTVQCQQQQKVTSSSVSSSSSTTAVSQSRTSVSATSSSAGGGKSGGGSPFAKFKQMDQQANPTSGTKGAPLFKFTNQGLQQSASSAKDVLLYWCQCRTRDYQNIKIENFSSSWSDGLAFCALIHHFYPDAFDYDSLDAKNRRYNFDLAFRIADEKAGIYPLLDTEDMVAMGRRPDWKCVFTYVQSMYRKLKELA